MAFKKGEGGRPPGVRNKSTVIAKAAIEGCFEAIGGADAFKQWAQANPGEFYTKIYVKILPLQVSGPDGGDIPIKAIINNYVVPAPTPGNAPAR